MVLGIVFVIIAVVVAAATPLLIKRLEGQQSGGKPFVGGLFKRGGTEVNNGSKHAGETVSLRDVWEIRDIKGGVIRLSRGYRMILSLGAVDYSLMSESGQQSVISALIGAVMSFTYPVQIFGTAEGVETESYVGEINSFLRQSSGGLAEYGVMLGSYLMELTRDRAVQVYRRYLVLTADGDEDSAVKELSRQASVISSILSPAGISVEKLDTEGVLDLLGHIFNRGQAFKPSDLVKAGGLYFFKEGATEDVAA